MTAPSVPDTEGIIHAGRDSATARSVAIRQGDTMDIAVRARELPRGRIPLWSARDCRPGIFDAGRRPAGPSWPTSLACGQDVYMPSRRVTICPATTEEWPVVERLAQLERHDLSQFRDYVPRADGTYAFDNLDLFRAEPGRQAWLIRYGLTLAGFALTRPLESGGTSMYAFFIVRGLRRHGLGLQAAQELLRLIPGVWGIAFQDENADAQPFWEHVATEAVGDRWQLERVAGPEGHTADIWLRLDSRSAP